MIIYTKNGKSLDEKKDKVWLVGSVKTVRSRDINRPALIGQYPVFIEQYGSYRIFTYLSKIKSIGE